MCVPLKRTRFRDDINEPKALMGSDLQESDTSKGRVNDELTFINNQKTKQIQILPNTISGAIADTAWLNEKDALAWRPGARAGRRPHRRGW